MLILFVLIFVLFGAGSAWSNTYDSGFANTENPMSESGQWVQGKAVGGLWNNIRSTPGLAFGTQPGSGSFDDSIAHLSGTWGANQTVRAIAHKAVGHSGGEVEILLRFLITGNGVTGNARGYEVNWKVASDGSQYCQIVKWKGGLGQFVVMGGGGGACPAINEGSVVQASIDASNTIRLYHCGSTWNCSASNLIASFTDTNGQDAVSGPGVDDIPPWTASSSGGAGAPGIGTYLPAGSGLTQSNYGLSRVVATDGTLRQAATCSNSDVQTQLTAAAGDDLVMIPDGSCTWTTTVDPGSKSVVLMGKGTGTDTQCGVGGQTSFTCITLGSAIQRMLNWTLVTSGSPRITGITWDTGTVGADVPETTGPVSIQGTSSSFRMDHGKYYAKRGAIVVFNGYVRGVVDHNLFTTVGHVGGGRIPVFVHHAKWGGSAPNCQEPIGCGDDSWANPPNWGSGNNLFFEDNTFENSTTYQYAIDGWKGQRYVARFNTTINASFQNHGTDTSARNRGGFARELYMNTCTTTADFPGCAASRGGSFLAWGNTCTGVIGSTCPQRFIDFSMYRLLASNQCTFWGCADDAANNTFDQGAGTSNGYQAMDQPGAGQGDRLSGDTASNKALISPQGWPHQALEPMYGWNNSIGGAESPIAPNSIHPNYYAENVTYYNKRTTFDGTKSLSGGNGGIGVGPRSSRPTTCTTGVAWWATDDSNNWNTVGADGALDKCVATNTWTNAVYVPYTYPHPLVLGNSVAGGGGDTTPPSVPSNLRIVSFGYNRINLAWDASTDDTGVTNYLVERVAGGSCSGFSQIGTSSSLTYNDIGVLTITPYCYRVRATDAASNLSAYSTNVSQTTDTAKFNPLFNLRRISYGYLSQEGSYEDPSTRHFLARMF